MTTYQILACLALLAVTAWYYLPAFKTVIPKPKTPDVLDHIEDIVNIRNSYDSPEITDACNALLHVLLGVKP